MCTYRGWHLLLSSQFIIFKDHPFSVTGPSVFVEVLIFALFVQTIASGWVDVRESSNPQLLRFVVSPSAVEQFIADHDLEGVFARHVEQEEKLKKGIFIEIQEHFEFKYVSIS